VPISGQDTSAGPAGSRCARCAASFRLAITTTVPVLCGASSRGARESEALPASGLSRIREPSGFCPSHVRIERGLRNLTDCIVERDCATFEPRSCKLDAEALNRSPTMFHDGSISAQREDRMTDKHELPPHTTERAQPNYREKIRSALTRLRVSSPENEQMVAAGWHHLEWVYGDVYGIAVLESGHLEIWIQGWTKDDPQTREALQDYCFHFRTWQDDFLAEVRRTQSHGLGFEFGGYLKDRLNDDLDPVLVQHITHYAAWERPHVDSSGGWTIDDNFPT